MASRRPLLLALLLVLPAVAPAAAATGNRTMTLNDTVSVRAAAVARTPDGLQGSTARIEVTVAPNGSGHVFLDTASFTQVDMQGSAKLATRVAASITGLPRDNFDYFFVVRTDSPIIGGPSAGAEMAVATIAAMKGWSVDEHAIMTGTVNLDGTVGPVGGIPEKAVAARGAGAGLFLYPEGQSNVTTASGDQVRMPSYCSGELGITCEAVTDVREAVQAMTGHEFPRPEPEGNVTGEGYEATLRPLAPQLVQRANATVRNASSSLEDADLDPDVRQALESRLSSARSVRDDAVAATQRDRYYTGASRAFQATVAARTVVEAVDVLTSSSPDLRYRDRASQALTQVDEAERAVEAETVDGLTELQAVGAAQSRVLDAEDRLNRSQERWRQAQASEEVLQAVNDLAYAFERAETVHWWLSIGQAFPPGPAVNQTEVQATAKETLATARDSLAYARVLSQKGQDQNPLVRRANEYISSARQAQDRGYHAATIYDALQAEAWASTGLSTAGLDAGSVQGRVDRAENRSGAAISDSRVAGVEPILAEAYYEFAGDFQNPIQALVYYGLAGTIARSASAFQAEDADANPSRFVGVHPDAEPPRTLSSQGQPPSVTLGLVAMSFTAGVTVAVGAILGRGRVE
jgi:uncharacterized protein